MISTENVRFKTKKILIACFMGMKADWTEKSYGENYQIAKLEAKVDKRLVKQSMMGLKWLMFYKKTKRAYLKFKK